MNPLGHIVSLMSSTVTSWCFSVGVVVVVVVVAMDAKGTRVEKGASERARRDASVAVATRLAAAIRPSSIRSGRRTIDRPLLSLAAAAAAARLLLRDGLVHVLVRVTGRERESVHGLAESDDDLMDASEGREGWDGTRSRGSWFSSSVDGRRVGRRREEGSTARRALVPRERRRRVRSTRTLSGVISAPLTAVTALMIACSRRRDGGRARRA
jgi:hypothetical protein